MKRALLVLLLIGMFLAVVGCAKPQEKPPAEKPAEKPAPEKPAEKPAPSLKEVYKGTVYVAGMGGHFAVADIIIDPSDTNLPIKVTSLGRIALGPGKQYGTHDPRIDWNTNLMFWSTYVNDSGYYHVGYVDLATGEVKVDKKVPIPKEVKKKPFGCGSGQTRDYYLPVFMTYPGYIDIYDKKTMELVKRVWIKGDPFPETYCWYHGTNSPDEKEFALIVTECTEPNNFKTSTGKVYLYILDLPALLNGELKVLRQMTLTGEPGKTAVFRQFYTNDGKYLLQSGRDRFWVIDVQNMKVVDEKILTAVGFPEGTENHDAMPTPDDKYAILTLRLPIQENGKTVKDGVIVLYDMQKKEIVGKPVSTCKACHGKAIGYGKSAILCGIEGFKTLKKTKIEETAVTGGATQAPTPAQPAEEEVQLGCG